MFHVKQKMRSCGLSEPFIFYFIYFYDILTSYIQKKDDDMAKTVAVINQKGGVGKTTTAVNLAAALGRLGKKTLLCDIDPQGNSTSGVGVDKNTVESSIYDVLIDGVSARNALVKTAFDNLYLIPSSLDLAGAEIEMISRENREKLLKTAMLSVWEDFDFIIFDCPPSLGIITIDALTACDSFLVPIQCEYFALEGLAQLMNTVRGIKRLYNPRISLEGVLLTMYDGRLNLTAQVVKEIKKYFKNKVYRTTIPRNVRLSEAPSFGEPVIYFDGASKGARAYMDFAEEFLGRQ